ncbi:MAG TPA: PQQ-binding-like beta-propeller repeat protein [Isosphaeraceae bacterium]|jgi:outer membrane protein assembly factor BamB|nr:PQQ-binding-like beta-propeller repeat protein [Isosphaeraceae bacterium]
MMARSKLGGGAAGWITLLGLAAGLTPGLPSATAQVARPGGVVVIPPPPPQPQPARPPGRGANHNGARFYPESSTVADALLRNAAAHARDGQWAEAVEIYQKVIAQFGETVAALPKDDPASDPEGQVTLFVGARQYCQRLIAALPPEARAIYRARVDAQAARWFKQGAERRDRALLRRVIDQAFCSSWGDDALELLGDLSFQDGRFAEALGYYRQILPDRPGEALGLVHPDPDVVLARVAAKALLCRAANGVEPPSPGDLAAFKKAYPDAKAKLVGREGMLSKLVADAIAEDHLAPPAQLDARWPTFAGAPSRSRVAPGNIDIGTLQWKVKLDPITPNRVMNNFGGMPTPPAGAALLAYYPIVLNDEVVIADEGKIVAFDLNERPSGGVGTVDKFLAWRHEHQLGSPPAARNSQSSTSFTLTAAGDRIYARLGSPGATFTNQFGGGPSPYNYLVAVERSTQGKMLWSRSSSQVELPRRRPNQAAPAAGFEGTPVADGRNVYIGLTEWGPMTSTYVACLDGETGATRWVRYLGDAQAAGMEGPGMFMGGFNAPMAFGNAADMGNRLLSLEGPTVYYQTNFGAVAALDAETGAVRWMATYPKVDRPTNGPGRGRELNPAVVQDGRVFVAPDDSPSIFAFDAATGRLLWHTGEETRAVVHLLGVARGHLIATGNHVFRVDVKTGKVLPRWPDNPRGFDAYGRGLLAGDSIYVPTRTEILVLDQEGGIPRADQEPFKLQERYGVGGGNLAVGNGYLVVAQADALVVFCANSRLIRRYQDEIAKAPERAAPYYRLAEAAGTVGDDELALSSLSQAIRHAAPSEMIDGKPLVEAAGDARYRLLMRLAARAESGRDWAVAAGRFDEAAGSARVDRERLDARLGQARALAERGDARAAVATLQGLLAEDRLRSLNVAADEHRTVRADLAIADRLAALIAKGGRGLYDAFDRKAAALADQGERDRDASLLEEVARAYPVARAVPEALLALGRLREGQGRPDDAAHAYKRLLARADADEPSRGRALWALAQCYEAQRLWVPARDAYLRAKGRFADVPLDGGSKLGPLAEARLAQPPFDKMAADDRDPEVPIPLARRWSRPAPEGTRPLVAQGVPPSSEVGRIFLAERSSLRPIRPEDGRAPWTADLGGEPAWVGYLADRVLAATSTKVVALGLEKGDVLWSFEPKAAAGAANPFAKVGEPRLSRRDAQADGLRGFKVVGNRVFFRRGDRELIALDGDTGQVDWSFAPASGRLGPQAWIGPRWIALQVRGPNETVVLDTATGRPQARERQADDEEWAREPVAVGDDQVAIVPDSWTVALLDLERCRVVWRFREAAPQPGAPKPANGPPLAFGDGERLLVLHNGTTLIRLDPKSGDRLWSRPLGLESLADRPSALAIDPGRCFAVNGRNLTSIRLDDGKVAWTRPLSGPSSGWELALTRRCLAAFPGASRPFDGEVDGLPLILVARDDGEPVQRLLLPTGPTDELAVRFAPKGALVAAGGGLWALGERRAVDAGGPSR